MSDHSEAIGGEPNIELVTSDSNQSEPSPPAAASLQVKQQADDLPRTALYSRTEPHCHPSTASSPTAPRVRLHHQRSPRNTLRSPYSPCIASCHCILRCHLPPAPLRSPPWCRTCGLALHSRPLHRSLPTTSSWLLRTGRRTARSAAHNLAPFPQRILPR
jgi:hypothetical protein